MTLNKVRQEHVDICSKYVEVHGKAAAKCVKRGDLSAFFQDHGYSVAPLSVLGNQVGRGFYDILWVVDEEGSVDKIEAEPTLELTDEEILADQRVRFENFHKITDALVAGAVKAVIAAGNPGIGKTYDVEDILERAAMDGKIKSFSPVKGYAKPTGLYRLMWENREAGQIVVLDDCDSIFRDEIGLNLLKVALDTTKSRRVSWRSEKIFETEDGDIIPNEFEFNGSIMFITNLDFDKLVQANSNLTPHLNALMSRSFYVDLHLRSTREMILRIMDVVETTDILSSLNLSQEKQAIIINFMKGNCNILRELSLRMLIKLGSIMQFSPTIKAFEGMAITTCTKR